jgi:hypothetical protein
MQKVRQVKYNVFLEKVKTIQKVRQNLRIFERYLQAKQTANND